MKRFTNRLRAFLATFLCLISFNVFSSPAPKISNNHAFKHSQTDITIVGAEITLPSKGLWTISAKDN
ncbi:MAG: hypothetical protein KAI17_06935, partial [Thiotrichaceae bacterium]|nr:hypothetical protein [Thiotrichaceae bacterium]